MNSIQQIKEELRKTLTKERFDHSVGTMEKAIELAKIYKIDEEKAAYCAITHDIAKEMTTEQLISYCEKNNINISEVDKLVPSVLHGIVGADLVKKQYNFTEEMQNAIYYHTTGREKMTLLDKIIYVADKSEEKTRIGEHADNLRSIIKNKGLDEAILFIIDEWTIKKTLENRKIIHPNTIYARNDIIKNIKK